MDSWIIEAQLPGYPPARITVGAYGIVDNVEPAGSPLHIVQDVDGFNVNGSNGFPYDPPDLLIKEVIEGDAMRRV